MPRLLDIQLCQPCNACIVLTAVNPLLMAVEEESHYISSSHIRLIRCLAVIGQASCSTREGCTGHCYPRHLHFMLIMICDE